MPGFTPKQKAALAAAPKQEREAMRKAYAKGAQLRKPAAKSAPKRAKPQSSKHLTVPNFLDPMCPIPAPTLVSEGNALPHTGLATIDFVVGTVNTTILLVTNVGNSGTIGYRVEVSPTGAFQGATPLDIPTLSLSRLNGGPTAMRAMKYSVSVVNCSNALKRGGRVTYLHTSQRLPHLPQPDNYSEIILGIKTSPLRRRITGDVLARPTKLVGYPIDTARYNSFREGVGGISLGDFLNYTTNRAITDVEPRSMSIVAYVFDPVQDPQDYSVTVRGSYYTRWPLTSVPGQSMQRIPTAPAEHINAVRDHHEANANEMKPIGEHPGLKFASAASTAVKTATSLARLARGEAGIFETALPLLQDVVPLLPGVVGL